MQAAELFGAAFAGVKARFDGLDVSIAIEAESETILRDPQNNLQTVVPVVKHGDDLKGSVTLAAPPGYERTFAGLTMTLRTAKVQTQKPPEPPSWMPKPSDEETEKKRLEAEAKPIVIADGTTDYVGCKANLYFLWSEVFTAEKPVVALEPGSYDVKGKIVVPFSVPTTNLPALETLESDAGVGIVHWVEARVAWTGWRGWLQWALEARHSMNAKRVDASWLAKKEGGVMAMMAKEDPSLTSKVSCPAGDAHSLLALQVTEAEAPAEAGAQAWLTVGDFGGECRLDVEHGKLEGVVLGEGCELLVVGSAAHSRLSTAQRARLRVSGTRPLKRIELQLMTAIDGADPPLATRTMVVWSSAEASATGAETGFGAQQLGCSFAKQTLKLRTLDDGEAMDITVEAQVVHSVLLRLLDADDKPAWNSVPVTLRRAVVSGSPAGELVPERPSLKPKKPLIVRILIGIAILLLGWYSTLVVFSFMAPVKMTWAYEYIDQREAAETYGLLPSNNTNSTGGYMRSMMVGGTRSLKKFLTGVR